MRVTKRDWIQKSTVAVMLGTSLLMFAENGQAAEASDDSQLSGKAEQVAALAQSLLGKDYKYGAEGPTQFGSAGLATYIFGKVGVTIEDTIAELYRSGKTVSKDQVKAGDLLFFSSKGTGNPNFMGIYVGNDRFIYSSQGEYEVVEKRLSAYTGKLVGVRSFLTDGTGTSNPAPAKPPVNNDAESKGDKVIEAGKKYLGTPYQYGSTRSNKDTMDCSEFTMWAYRDGLGIDMGRGGARSQANYVKQHGHYTYDMKQLKKGDLVFFMSYRGWKESDYKGVDPLKQSITHVGIYMGDDKLLQTFSKESGGVKITNFSDTHWEYRFIMGGRPY
ncbi:NlpC/P60 family protein [Brevibacillus sp. FSL K6-2834]|uniref:C40 family peptidase n=1 Tax=Brevibacillus sp. FSL K6-2834 TaxID=2954680 RepID=UPI00315815B3